jgi:predicted nucleotidyltransferase
MANRVAQEAFNHLIGDLKATHGDNLASVVLYGSAASGDFVQTESDYNLLIALHRIAPEDLRLAQPPMREWQRLGHPLPVYFTFSELRDAADVFPIEFRQMERARVVLYGRDPFETLRLSDENLRHQTEYELRSKLIQLRRLYIPASASAERLRDLMSDSLSSFATLFAPVLLLHGAEPPVLKREVVAAAARLLGLDGRVFERVFEMRESGDDSAPNERAANELFAAYMAEIERVIDAVDRLEVKGQRSEVSS